MGANNSVPANYNAAGYAILVLEIILTTTAVVGRTWSRKLMKAALSTDDILAYFAYSVNLGLVAGSLVLTSHGALDLSEVSVESEEQRQFVRGAYSSIAILYVIGMTSIKLSILFLYRRTFRTYEVWFRYMWWIVLYFIIAWAITCFVLLGIQGVGQMPRWRLSRLGISTTGLANAFSDILLLLMPAFMISKLKLRRKQKIALISIFGIGGIASLVSIVRATIFFIDRDHRLNEAYSNYLDIILTATESSAGLMCACLPLTKPVVIRFSRWIQRLRGFNTGHQGWSTMNDSQESSGKAQDLTVTKSDDYHVQLLSVTRAIDTESQPAQDAMVVKKPLQSVGPYKETADFESHKPREPSSPTVAQWELQNTWGGGKTLPVKSNS